MSDGVTAVTESFDVTVTNNTPTLDPISDRTMSYNDDTLTITLTANDLDGDPLTYTTEVFINDSLAQLAYDLDQELGLYRPGGGYSTNYRGAGEKYLQGNNNSWYFLLENGELHRWGGSIAASTLVATLDSSYYADPTLLHDAQVPSDQVTLSLSGNMLTIDPADGFAGSFQIRVGVSDGVTAVTESFDVTVTASASQAAVAALSSESESAAKRTATDTALSEHYLRKGAVALFEGMLSGGFHYSAIDKYFDSLEDYLYRYI